VDKAEEVEDIEEVRTSSRPLPFALAAKSHRVKHAFGSQGNTGALDAMLFALCPSPYATCALHLTRADLLTIPHEDCELETEDFFSLSAPCSMLQCRTG
jgi:hypothetical protein